MKTLLLLGALALSINVFAQSTVKIGNLEVMTKDLGKMNWNDAKKACADLGGGWRIPTKEEGKILVENKKKIGGWDGSYYWSSTEAETTGVFWAWTPFGGYERRTHNTKSASVRAVR